MKPWIVLAAVLTLSAFSTPAQAHRSGCHRWHSCPSDRGTYTCGDAGYSSGCPVSTPVRLSTPAPVAAGTPHTVTGVNLRSQPSTQGRILAVLKSGTALHLLKCQNGWCQVEAADRTGYVIQRAIR